MTAKMKSVIDTLVKELQNSEEYLRYEECKKVIMEDYKLRDSVIRTRNIREQLSNMAEYERNGDFAERLEEEYDNLCDITAVHEFSLAELEICALYQDVMSAVAGSFNIELDNR